MPRANFVTWDGRTQGAITVNCPGCGDRHVMPVAPAEGGARWEFNGDLDLPTLSPSVLVTSGHYCAGHKDGAPCWCTWNVDHPNDSAPFKCYRCHSFIVGGRIQFLPDCTHELAGQTVDLPEVEAWGN